MPKKCKFFTRNRWLISAFLVVVLLPCRFLIVHCRNLGHVSFLFVPTNQVFASVGNFRRNRLFWKREKREFGKSHIFSLFGCFGVYLRVSSSQRHSASSFLGKVGCARLLHSKYVLGYNVGVRGGSGGVYSSIENQNSAKLGDPISRDLGTSCIFYVWSI